MRKSDEAVKIVEVTAPKENSVDLVQRKPKNPMTFGDPKTVQGSRGFMSLFEIYRSSHLFLVARPSPPSLELDGSLTDSNPPASFSLDESGEVYARGNGVSGTQRGRSADETLICVLGLITLRSPLGGVSRNA